MEIHYGEDTAREKKGGRRFRLGLLGWFAVVFCAAAGWYLWLSPWLSITRYERCDWPGSIFYDEAITPEQRKEILVSAGKPGLNLLLEKVRDPAFPRRGLAVEAIGDINSCRAVDTLELIALNRKEDLIIRQLAIDAIGRIGYYPAVQALRRIDRSIQDPILKKAVLDSWELVARHDPNERL